MLSVLPRMKRTEKRRVLRTYPEDHGEETPIKHRLLTRGEKERVEESACFQNSPTFKEIFRLASR